MLTLVVGEAKLLLKKLGRTGGPSLGVGSCDVSTFISFNLKCNKTGDLGFELQSNYSVIGKPINSVNQ